MYWYTIFQVNLCFITSFIATSFFIKRKYFLQLHWSSFALKPLAPKHFGCLYAQAFQSASQLSLSKFVLDLETDRHSQIQPRYWIKQESTSGLRGDYRAIPRSGSVSPSAFGTFIPKLDGLKRVGGFMLHVLVWAIMCPSQWPRHLFWQTSGQMLSETQALWQFRHLSIQTRLCLPNLVSQELCEASYQCKASSLFRPLQGASSKPMVIAKSARMGQSHFTASQRRVMGSTPSRSIQLVLQLHSEDTVRWKQVMQQTQDC